ncbi:bifunctional phosphatase PAP2/diacylglycerol kinase family protein [Kutzneria buriramensis]|uniref:Undecaprenyl-diphosphatase n=1 Tax=Kutzneria buriramensis TaxID=1045776 RepID=A0A3E0GYN8_9PSEU|nr:bifunctional phosphatase PAP2/diacylglycerol kinase family protein [Kutzneria buriramensis]REH35230.1 undecaprenyl-diphosphatase [Kutzneria buriramensis]
MRRSAALKPSRADFFVKRLSTSANHSLIWFTAAAVLATIPGRGRRAALRGVVAIAGASFTASLVGKRVFPRRRPAADLVPVARRLTRRPTSSSFPSGHAASAAAFTTAVALESPTAAAFVAPVAAAVAYSRVHTGVHWPTDVMFGAAIGVGVGMLTQRWWPLGVGEAALSDDRVRTPVLPDGQGLAVVANPNSGPDDTDPAVEIKAAWPRADVIRIDDLRDLDLTDVRALGAAGGDGTVSAVAEVAAAHGLPLVVVPAGTLNHFARDIGVESLEQSRTATESGEGITIGLGSVAVDGGEPSIFLNTASLGGYPDLVRLRDKHAKRWGKWPAGAYALVRVLHEAEPLVVTLDGRREEVWMIFVGNNPYMPKGFAPATRHRLDSGLLDVRYISADIPFSRTRFVLAAVAGALHRSHTYRQVDLPEVDVRVHGRPVALATDGEVHPEGRLFHFESRPTALTVYR